MNVQCMTVRLVVLHVFNIFALSLLQLHSIDFKCYLFDEEFLLYLTTDDEIHFIVVFCIVKNHVRGTG